MSNPQPEVPSRRQRRRLEAMERTLDAAGRLFAEKGYDRTTVAQICAEAGIAYGTFFNHFSSKSDLLTGLTERSKRRLGERLETLAKGRATIEAQLRSLLLETPDGRAAREPSQRQLQGLIWLTAATEGGAEGDEHFHAAFRSFLGEGIARGRVRDDVPLDTMAEVVSSVFSSMVLSWVHDERYPLQKRAKAAASFLAEALTPRGER